MKTIHPLKFTRRLNVYNGLIAIGILTIVHWHAFANIMFMAFVIGIACEISMKRDAEKFGGME